MKTNAQHRRKHLARGKRWREEAIRRLLRRADRQRSGVPGEFLRGAAYKLGSGAVTLLVLWWETRR